MKLNAKMILIFSVMMLLALFILSSYAATASINGADSFFEARYRNTSVSIQRELEMNISMMKITLQELTDNTSFMAALNQMVRDDSADQKMALAARKAAAQQLLQSPLVNMFYRVTFYTRDGVFLTSYTDKDQRMAAGDREAKTAVEKLRWLDRADDNAGAIILAPYEDALSPGHPAQVYGIAQKILYKGNPLGYIEICNRYEELGRITEIIDDPAVSVQVLFSDGAPLFQTPGADWAWPQALAPGELTLATVGEKESRQVLYTYSKALGLRFYISQSSAINAEMNKRIYSSMTLRAIYILLPTMVLIAFISFSLTASTRKLTKKVQNLSVERVLANQPEAIQALSETVSTPQDAEVYELESVFNEMMLRLRDTAANNLALREGFLQAQLSALQAQINPHFIYNTLNIISAKSMESGNFDVIEICDQFAQLLRYSTDTRSRTAAMTEEIENTRNYLLLAKARYEDNLEYAIDVPENLGEITVPKLTLQPLVENAMIHGFNGKNVLRKLSVTGRIEDGYLILEIRDNGTGFAPETLQKLRTAIQEIESGTLSVESSGGHIGLVNTCLRLHYYSQGKMHIAIRNDNGAVITMTFPCAENA